MPRPAMPPTPASSTEIKGRDDPTIGFSQISFELPPSAYEDSRPSSAESNISSASSYHPTSPKTLTQARKRSSIATANSSNKDVFALPPPPSRSRKIIQMKPVIQDGSEVGGLEKVSSGTKQVPAKKKTPSASSAAGRKIARKTAHSLIERRRRSKMNEEFGVLKNMIPACTGEMHKLAILQASIDYIRYLEDCVAKLKAQNSGSTPTPESTLDFVPPAARANNYETDNDEDDDVEMGGSTSISPRISSTAVPHQRSVSPEIWAQETRAHQNSVSTSASSYPDGRHYSYSSSTTSPAFGPQSHQYASSVTSANSALTSPALGPQSESERNLDHEATAALLMLNTDRRGQTGKGRGMSVMELLSS